MSHTFDFIFTVCIGVGIIVPLLDVLLGFLGSVFDFDLDVFGHHFGDMFHMDGDGTGAGSSLPFNFMCLCFSLVVFGAIGKLVTGLMVNVLFAVLLLLGLLCVSAAAYILLYRFVIRPLKKSNPAAIGTWDLLGARGKLTLRISEESPGTVSLKDSTGAMISYIASARAEVLKKWDGIIPQGAEVIVVDIDTAKKTAFVKPLDTFENNRLRQKIN
jgi:membrane protein implicated in regulation of membrane protease activity